MSEKIIADNWLGLDVGCGNSKRPTLLGIDLQRTNCVDLLADATRLPFKDGSFDYVSSSHVIEHFSHRFTDLVLCEWVRVLKKGGEIDIRCPDLRIRAFLFFLNPNSQNIHHIYGEQDHDGNFHKNGFTYKSLKCTLNNAGIKDVSRIIDGYRGIPFIPDCLHVHGIKE
jgi:SAM-dependent methyltransferase